MSDSHDCYTPPAVDALKANADIFKRIVTGADDETIPVPGGGTAPTIAKSIKDRLDASSLDTAGQGLSDRIDADIEARERQVAALQMRIGNDEGALGAHVADTSNPHGLTKAQIGLGDVGNVAPGSMPVSTAQQSALAAIRARLSPIYAVAGGTADAITLATPAGAGAVAMADGMSLLFTPPGANAGAVTIALNGGTTHALVSDAAGTALDAGALSAVPTLIAYDAGNSRWVMVSGAALPDSLHFGGDYVGGSYVGKYGFAIRDGRGAVSMGVTQTGGVEVSDLDARALTVGQGVLSPDRSPGYGLAVADDPGNAAFAVGIDGRAALSNPIVTGNTGRTMRSGINAPREILTLIGAGQSNMHGSEVMSAGGVSITSPYNNVGVLDYGFVEPLTSYLGRNIGGARRETAVIGAANYCTELLDKHGVDWRSSDHTVAAINSAQGGNAISRLQPGGDSGKFEYGIGLLGKSDHIATRARLGSRAATLFAQGETDHQNDGYLAELLALAASYQTSIEGVTGQVAAPFITWQLSYTTAAALTLTRPTHATRRAANMVPYIYCCGPSYHFPRTSDGIHMTSRSMSWLGAQFALVVDAVMFRREDWRPLEPTHHKVHGNVIDIWFTRRGLVFDTTTLPAQPNQGFGVKDGSDSPITISSVEIIDGERVRLTCASAPQPGWSFNYGETGMTGFTAWTYTGPGGNLRDSQGDTLIYDAINEPMHNWCCIFREEL